MAAGVVILMTLMISTKLGKKLVRTVWETYKDDEAWYDAHVQAEVSPITILLI